MTACRRAQLNHFLVASGWATHGKKKTERPVGRSAFPYLGGSSRDPTSISASCYGSVMVFLLPSVTAPFRARARPMSVTSSFRVIDVKARMLPLKVDGPTPSVAELPTWKYTLAACAPLIRMMLPVWVSVLPAWKTKTALGSPPPSSVRSPVMSIDDALQ